MLPLQKLPEFWHNGSRKALSRLLPLLFPRHCPVCDGLVPYGSYICPSCRKLLPLVRGNVCLCCGKPVSSPDQEFCYDCRVFPKSFEGGCSLFLYNHITAPGMMNLKYHNRRSLASFYSREIVRCKASVFKHWKADAVVPVPIHPHKRKKRGYNQAELLSAEIASLLNIRHIPNLLLRIIDTLPQKQFSPQARLTNLQRAFQINSRSDIREIHRIILVDDIYTTGATMEACTRILHQAGISHVYVCSICIGLSRD